MPCAILGNDTFSPHMPASTRHKLVVYHVSLLHPDQQQALASLIRFDPTVKLVEISEEESHGCNLLLCAIAHDLSRYEGSSGVMGFIAQEERDWREWSEQLGNVSWAH